MEPIYIVRYLGRIGDWIRSGLVRGQTYLQIRSIPEFFLKKIPNPPRYPKIPEKSDPLGTDNRSDTDKLAKMAIPSCEEELFVAYIG